MKRLYNVNTGAALSLEKDAVGNYLLLPNNVKHYYLTATIAHNAATTAVAGSRMTDGIGNEFRSVNDSGLKWKMYATTA